MKQRILTAALIIAVVLPPLILGGVLIDLLMLFCLVTGAYEITHCLKMCIRDSGQRSDRAEPGGLVSALSRNE